MGVGLVQPELGWSLSLGRGAVCDTGGQSVAVFQLSDKISPSEDEANSRAEHRAHAEGTEGVCPCASCRLVT